MSNPTEIPDTAGEPDGNPEEVHEPDAPEVADNSVEKVDKPAEVSPESGENSEDEPDTFPRAYVEKLRKENADARAKVKDRDDLAARLHTALAAADGRLADPTDLPYSEDKLDPDAMGKAIADLIARKPHLKAKFIKGDVGQGPRGNTSPQVDLLGTLRNLAG